jgi:undecaprenyl-diphosphatase
MAPTALQIIILGLVQGAAELLPVSSSAHVIAAEKLMRLDPSSPEMTFLIVMLHTGTMLAMIAYFWKSWMVSFFSSRAVAVGAMGRIALATALTGVVGLGLQVVLVGILRRAHPGAEIEDLFSNLPLIAAALAVAGLLIVLSGSRSRDASPGPGLTTGTSAAIGVVQGVCLPFRGLSRSGATISAAMLMRVPRRAAEEFSFALAVVLTPPLIVRELKRLYAARAAGGAHVALGALTAPGLLGMACSFAAGLAALAWLSGWLENGRWHYFGYYCFAAAAGISVLSALGF